LLQRYGLVSRETARAEGLRGGFATLYPVLKGLEETGRVRRGYFVEGLSGAQFAMAAAVERLRGARLDEPPLEGFAAEAVQLLPALDPANVYGALLPWPAVAGGTVQPRRAVGAWVVLVAGQAVLWLGPRGRQLLVFAGAEPANLALGCRALHGLSRLGQRSRLLIEQINGQAAGEAALASVLLDNGFLSDYRGLARDPGWQPDS
jgi:ATP-dependent Lhr-like helicase